jgi:hypothetical protein
MDILDLAFKGFWLKQNELRIKEQMKLYHYYVGEKDKVIKYLDDVLCKTFDEKDVEEFQLNWLNVTEKVINSLAVVYRDPAVRYFADEFDSLGDKKKDNFTNYYNSILPSNINTKDKTANRYAKLFNTALTQIDFDETTGKIFYNNRSSHFYDVVVDENNIYKPTKISYKTYKTLKDEPEEVRIVWTDTDHYGIDSYGNDFAIGNNKGKKNPYGRLPFAIIREQEQGDFWGNGASDLVDANEQINFILTNLINAGVVMQAWGTPVAINCGLSKRTEDGNLKFRQLRMGVKHPLIVENAKPGEAQPSLEYKNANPLIKEVADVIDWHIIKLCVLKGLDPNRIVGQLTEASGFAKIVDAIEQMELRRDSLEPCKEYEQERFEITRLVNNYWANTSTGSKFGLKKIPDDKKLVVDFAEIKAPVDAETQILVDDFLLKRNAISIMDIVRRQNPDLTDEELEKVLITNKQQNEKYLPEVDIQNNVDNVRKQRLSDKMIQTNKGKE